MADSTMTIKLCKDYPFCDTSNVFDYSANAHKIDEFVANYIDTTNGIIEDVADVNITGGYVRIAKKFESANNYNYMIIEKGTKKYYCFIKSVSWINNLNTTGIHFQLDIWNTYRNDIKFHDSYIEREHVQYDTKYTHLVDEGFSPSQYFTNVSPSNYGYDTIDLGDYGWVLALSDSSFVFDGSPLDPSSRTVPVVTQVAKNQFSPLLVKIPRVDIPDLIDMYIRSGKESAIIGVFQLPKSVINDRITTAGYVKICDVNSDGTIDYETFIGRPCTYVTESTSNFEASAKSYPPPNRYKQTITGESYSPENNKCFNYPFTILQIGTHLGTSLDLSFEKSNVLNHYITINYVPDANINGSFYIAPYNYDGCGTTMNADYMLLSINYPTVPFVVNSYDSWYASNQNTLANQRKYIDYDYKFNLEKGAVWATREQMGNSVTAIENIATKGNVVGALFGYAMSNQEAYKDAVVKKAEMDYSYASALSSFNANLQDKALMPTKINGLNSPNALLATNHNEIVVRYLMPPLDEIKSIDDYFTKYGYKVNIYSEVNLYYRPRFDFKKIPDCNITGNIPTDFLNVIRAMFQQGVTIWHDANNIFSYSDNAPGTQPPQPPHPA